MKIYIDADACPNVVKDIVYRASERLKIPVILVANRFLCVPKSELISSIMVPDGLDVADDKIVELSEAGDLVITADIPLASEIIAKDVHALNPRGEMYTKTNISQRLSMRDFMSELRSCGVETGGPPPLGKKDSEKFANALNRFLCKYGSSK